MSRENKILYLEYKCKDGTLLSDEASILCRWKEYFSELLNLVEGTEGDRSEVTDGAENSPTVTEVVAAIKSLKNGKAAGVDEIRPEMLKAFGEEGVQWLSRVIKWPGKVVQYLGIGRPE